MEEPTQHPFFVYGTLLPSQPNYALWQAAIISQEPAMFSGGRLYDMGYYPMLIPTEQEEDVVKGMVITVDPANYATVLQKLDNLEGYNPKQPNESAYQRQQVAVLLDNGRFQTSWIYIGAPQFVQGKSVVPDGDWATYAANNQSVLDAWWQSIDSVAGLHEE